MPAAAVSSATLAGEFFVGSTTLDVTSTTLKTVDASLSDGEWSAVGDQALKASISFGLGRLIPASNITSLSVNSGGRVINSLGRYESTQYVMGQASTTFRRDATRVIVPFIFNKED